MGKPLPLRSVQTLVCILVIAAQHTPRAWGHDRSETRPVGVCHPVQGTGRVVSSDGAFPIGSLTPLFAGDTVVVQAGVITIRDFRSGQIQRLGANSVFTVNPGSVQRPGWVERLRDLLLQGMAKPDLERLRGSVRAPGGTYFPDRVRYAPDVPIVLRWRGAHPAPRAVRIVHGADTISTELDEHATGDGGFAWQPAASSPPGPATWSLMDAAGRMIFRGSVSIMSHAEAESARAHYRAKARQPGPEPGNEDLDLHAAVLAAADRLRLW